jgi:signal transduction histidine kinase
MPDLKGIISGKISKKSKLLVSLAFISLTTIIGVFIFEQISSIFFHPYLFMNAHIFTVIMMGLLTPIAALLVMLRIDAFNRALVKENEERRKAESELAGAKAQAELYIDLMCHDINNLIQVSMGYLELAIDKVSAEGKLETDNVSLVKKPLDSIRNIATLIANVRKLQMEQSGQARHKPMDVDRVLREIVSQYSNYPDRDIKINYHRKNGCTVMANELITDLYANIVGNAIKHSGGPLTIDIGLATILEEGKKYCWVTIEDNGPGMPEEQKKHLSDRSGSVNFRYTGKGFGLYLVKTLIENFRGKLYLEDRVPGDYSKGTKVTIKIPEDEYHSSSSL